MKAEILKRLKEADGFVSGQNLCAQFDVSRTAVWKVIRQLEEEGYQIEAVPSKGYKLTDTSDVLNREELLSCIRGSWAGREVDYSEAVESTNIRARQLAECGAVHGTLVVAESQTGGKGRRGKKWVSPSGNGIWMSLILRPQMLPSSASMITLAAALSVTEGIREACGLDCLIKWPNDITAEGKKLCGILTEMSAELEEIHYIVVGIGINANIVSFPEEIRETASSLCLLTGKNVRRSQVIAEVMRAMEIYYSRFMECGDLSLLKDTYNARLANIGRQVKVLGLKEEYTGIARGIDESGELLIEMEDKSVRRVISGEVSVRGIYGYV